MHGIGDSKSEEKEESEIAATSPSDSLALQERSSSFNEWKPM